MASNKILQDFLNSIEIFGKTSDLNIIGELESSVKRTKTGKISQDTIDSFIAGTIPIDRSDIGPSIINLATSAMIVNNKVNPAISLADYKTITRSNYEVIDVGGSIVRTVESSLKDELKNVREVIVPKEVSLLQDALDNWKKDFKGLFKNLSNFSADLVDDYTLYNYLETTSEIKRLSSDEWKELESSVWLQNVIEQESSFGTFRFNHSVYREGKTFQMIPRYSKYTDIAISNLAVRWVNKFSSYRRKKGKYPYHKETTTEKQKISFNVNQDLALKASNVMSQNYKNHERRRNNPFITDLLNAGPDMNKNMFDVYLRFNSSPSHKSISNFEEKDIRDVTSYLFFTPILVSTSKGKAKQKINYVQDATFTDVYSLSVRTASVDIPMINRETESLNVLNTTVERPSNKVTFNTEGTLSVDCDANTYVAEMFLALAGLQRDGKFRNEIATKLEDIKEDMYNRSKGQYPFMAPAKLGFEMNTVDLVVSSHGLCKYNDKTYNPGGGGFYSNVLYVFEDVRFLGSPTDITFNPENATSLALDVPFIFKRMNTYYKPDNLGYAITSGVGTSSMFNNRNLNGTYYDEDSITEKIGF